ncbi:hypothetical protein VPHK479_0087 [Vibrio phage K479]
MIYEPLVQNPKISAEQMVYIANQTKQAMSYTMVPLNQ